MKKAFTYNDYTISGYDDVKCIVAGNSLDVRYMRWVNTDIKIKKLSATEYVTLEDGEIHEIKEIKARDENYDSLRRTFADLRNVINSNVLDASKVHWITLTYDQALYGVMRDTEQVYIDTKAFMTRLRRAYPLNSIKFITVLEAQQSGAWHMHIILLWNSKAPYIDNFLLRYRYWQKGFVSIKKIKKECTNIGAYFCAYLADLDFDEVEDEDIDFDGVKNMVVDGKQKKFIKGARLKYYPAHTKIFRCSRGLLEPVEETMSYAEFKRKYKGVQLKYKSCSFYGSDEQIEGGYIDNLQVIAYENYDISEFKKREAEKARLARFEGKVENIKWK